MRDRVDPTNAAKIESEYFYCFTFARANTMAELYKIKRYGGKTTYLCMHHALWGGPSRERRDVIANLYYLNKVYGLYSTSECSFIISSRPFRLFVDPVINERTDMFWKSNIKWTDSYASVEKCGSFVQYLGNSHEIQYCAAAVGLPYDIVGIIEMMILAIV